MSISRRVWGWIRRQIVDDVPEGDALCEFDCRKPQCTEGEWDVCERRLHRAAGELMPEKEAEGEAATPPAKDREGLSAPPFGPSKT